MNVLEPAFLIVGTPRSGTTLVQRLACELPEVRVPHETHFFSLHAEGLLRRRRFPLVGAELREELEIWASNEGLQGRAINLDAIVERLDGRAESLWILFSAIVTELAGDAEIIGEKTPDHLLWVPTLARAVPRLRFVVVVRDPRAVVASMGGVPFSMRGHVLQAERWLADQRLLRSAARQLGAERLLLLRYEDIVRQPQEARQQLASFLGVSAAPIQGSPGDLFLPWEWWKVRALDQISTDRIGAWKDALTRRQVAQVVAICRGEMAAYGYEDGRPGVAAALSALGRIRPSDQIRRIRYRRGRRRRLRWLASRRVHEGLVAPRREAVVAS